MALATTDAKTRGQLTVEGPDRARHDLERRLDLGAVGLGREELRRGDDRDDDPSDVAVCVAEGCRCALHESRRRIVAASPDGGVVVAGTIRIVGNKVTFHDLAGTFACRGATKINGSYTWRIQGAKLTFTRVSDACPGRKGVLSHAFTRIA